MAKLFLREAGREQQIVPHFIPKGRRSGAWEVKQGTYWWPWEATYCTYWCPCEASYGTYRCPWADGQPHKAPEGVLGQTLAGVHFSAFAMSGRLKKNSICLFGLKLDECCDVPTGTCSRRWGFFCGCEVSYGSHMVPIGNHGDLEEEVRKENVAPYRLLDPFWVLSKGRWFEELLLG